MDINVMFATPSLDHRVCLDFLCSTIETSRLLLLSNVPHGFLQIGGDPYLAKVRNKLVTQFLEDFPDATDLFFLDDDIGWPAGKVVEFLRRPEDVIAGVYPKKSDRLDFPVQLDMDEKAGTLIENLGLVRAGGVPTGFLRIKRHVLETLAKDAGKFKDVDQAGNEREYINIFEMGAGPDGYWWGEDYVFCRKWIDRGGSVWVDPDISFTHRGTKPWRANLNDHLQAFRDKALMMVPEGGSS